MCLIRMKRAIKVILPVLLLIALMLGTILTANALTVVQTHIIDNDDAQGYTVERRGFDTWFQASNLYYQDARRQLCDSESNVYRYMFPAYTRNTAIYGKTSAYLYDVSFTDPEACYYLNNYADGAYLTTGYINQDLAAPGWNVIGTRSTTAAGNGLHRTQSIMLVAGKNHPTKYCGADAIKIELSY